MSSPAKFPLPSLIPFASVVFFFLMIACSDRGKVSSFSAQDKKDILSLLNEQQTDWNNGDINSFMDGYVKSDSMQFVGSKGITFGWEQTLTNYKLRYPDTVTMGKLHFEIMRINPISADAAWLTGRYHLKRTIGDATGVFTLVFRKIEGEWKIAYDHTGN
jgi:ketosteroid isomerase-like protein